MLSLGMLFAFAFAMQSRRRALNSGFAEPPSLMAIAISRPILVKIFAFFASFAPLRLAILCHLECPDMLECPSFYHYIIIKQTAKRHTAQKNFIRFFAFPQALCVYFSPLRANYDRKLQK